MKPPLFDIVTKPFSIVFICIVYALLQTLAFSPLMTYPFLLLALDAFVDAAFFAGLGFLLWKVIRYGNFAALELYQRFINYTALGLLVIGVWIAASYLASYLILDERFLLEIKKIIWMKGFIGLLTYLLIIQLFQVKLNRLLEQEKLSDEAEEETSEGNASPTMETIERVVVKVGQKIHVLFVPDIVYIQSDGDYVQIFTENGKYLKEETMKYFEMNLPQSQFVRIHRSYIVNVGKILRIELYEKTNQMLTLKNGDKIKASASGYKLLRKALSL